jgi:hypothetical protein
MPMVRHFGPRRPLVLGLAGEGFPCPPLAYFFWPTKLYFVQIATSFALDVCHAAHLGTPFGKQYLQTGDIGLYLPPANNIFIKGKFGDVVFGHFQFLFASSFGIRADSAFMAISAAMMVAVLAV